jgi:hypothetical protein
LQWTIVASATLSQQNVPSLSETFKSLSQTSYCLGGKEPVKNSINTFTDVIKLLLLRTHVQGHNDHVIFSRGTPPASSKARQVHPHRFSYFFQRLPVIRHLLQHHSTKTCLKPAKLQEHQVSM